MSKQSTQLKLSIASINYAGGGGAEKKEANNIFEFYSNDLKTNSKFNEAQTEFSNIDYNQFLSLVTKPELNVMLTHITLSNEDKRKSIRTLVLENKIHWGGDNKALNRPNAIAQSM